MTNVGPQFKLPSNQTTYSFLTSGNGAGYANFGKIGLADSYSNIDLTNYRLDVINGKIRFQIPSTDNASDKNFIVGASGKRYLAFGGAGIQAYDASNAASSLYLNYNGGSLEIGSSTNPLTSGNFYGSYDFKSQNGFTYSGIGAASDNAERNVWFSYNGILGRPVYDNDFKYNPSTNSLHIIHAAGKDPGEVRVTYSTTVDMGLGIGSANANHGLYDFKASKWMIVSDASGNVTVNGNAATATKLTTARTISLTGSVTGSGSFDGSGNLSIATTTNHNHDSSYVNITGDTMTGSLQIKALGKDNFISVPDKHFASADGTKVGAIKITFPVSWTATMMSMKVDIYNYNNDNAITYTIGGYNYDGSGGYWTNCSAQCSGIGDKSNLKVRFAHDGTKCCIIIGEINTSWSYPKVVIRDILLGHSGTTLANWIVGWDIGWITELPENIDVTKENTNITSNYPTKTGVGASGTWGISITGNAATATKLAASKNINGTAFDGSASITTVNWGTARNISISDSDGTNTGTAVSVNGSAAVTLKLPATIKATLTGNADTATRLLYRTNLIKGTDPSPDQVWYLESWGYEAGTDTGVQNRLGGFEYSIDTNGSSHLYLRAYQYVAGGTDHTSLHVECTKTGVKAVTTDGYMVANEGFYAGTGSTNCRYYMWNSNASTWYPVIVDHNNGDMGYNGTGGICHLGWDNTTKILVGPYNNGKYWKQQVDDDHTIVCSRNPGADALSQCAIEIRENNEVAAGQSSIDYAPKLGFHWGNRCAGFIALNSSNWFDFKNQSNNGYKGINVGGLTSYNGYINLILESVNASLANNNVSSTIYPTPFNILDSAGRIMCRSEAVIFPGGTIRGYWYVRNYNTSGGEIVQKGIHIDANKDGSFSAGCDSPFYGAVWNDYAEYRESNITEPGRCIRETGNGDLVLTTKRLEKGCEIISDTFGFAIGQSDVCKTPTAATGRVLAYLLESIEEARENIGQAVCSGPNGTVSIMTDEECRLWPQCIIGTISEIPDYEIWHAGMQEGNKFEEIQVNGRIWIRIR